MKRFSRHALIAIQMLVSLAFVWGLLRRTNFEQIATHVAAASLSLLAISLVTKFMGFSLMAARLQRFSSGAGGLGFGESFRAQSIAFVGNNVLPLRLGEALKIGFMSRRGLSSISACIGIAAVERILDSLFLVLFIGAALLLFSDVIPASGALYLFSAVACAAFGVLCLAARLPDRFTSLVATVTSLLGARQSKLLTGYAAQFARGISALASPRLLISLVALTAGYWIFSALSVYIWILACGIEVPWHAAIVVLVFVSLSTVIPSAPGFIGTYHYFAALALGLFDVAPEMAASFAIVGHAVAIIPFTILLSPFVAKDIVALHRAGIPKVVGATRQLDDRAPEHDASSGEPRETGEAAEPTGVTEPVAAIRSS